MSDTCTHARPMTVVRQMSFFPHLPDTISALTNRQREFSEERVLGYTPEMVYEVVADLNSYYRFLPWCKESQYIRESPEKSIAKLSVGFPPLVENYTAMVLFKYPRSIRVSWLCGRCDREGVVVSVWCEW